MGRVVRALWNKTKEMKNICTRCGEIIYPSFLEPQDKDVCNTCEMEMDTLID